MEMESNGPEILVSDEFTRLLSIRVARNQLPQVLKAFRITADRMVQYAYGDAQGKIIEVGCTAKNLPKSHDCMVWAPSKNQTSILAWNSWGAYVDFFTVYRPDAAQTPYHYLSDIRVFRSFTYGSGVPIIHLDTAAPLTALDQTRQYMRLCGDIVCLNPEGRHGLTLIRIDSANRCILGLRHDGNGEARRLVAVSLDEVCHNPGVFKRPSDWKTVIKGDSSIIFYSRPENAGPYSSLVVNFADRTARRLCINYRSRDRIAAVWDGPPVNMNYLVVGALVGDQRTVVGYGQYADNLRIRFMPRIAA